MFLINHFNKFMSPQPAFFSILAQAAHVASGGAVGRS